MPPSKASSETAEVTAKVAASLKGPQHNTIKRKHFTVQKVEIVNFLTFKRMKMYTQLQKLYKVYVSSEYRSVV